MSTFLKEQAVKIADQVEHGMKIVGRSIDDDVDKVLSVITFDEWANIIDDTSQIMGDTFQEGIRAALLQLKITPTPDMTNLLNDKALAYAQKRAADLVGMKNIGTKLNPEWIDNPAVDEEGNKLWSIQPTTRDMLRADISTSMEEGWSTDQLKRMIMDNYAFSDDRADMIARTETAFADQHGNLQAWKDSGVVTGKYWVLAPQHEGGDECDDNVDDGVIGLDELFSSGDEAPPTHPNCRCDMACETIETGEEEGNESSND